MINLLKLVTIIIGTIMIVQSAITYIKRKNTNIIFFPMIVFYFFNYVPVILDVVVGRPEYLSRRVSFIKSGDDFITEVVYLFIILYIMIFFRFFQKKYVFQRELKITLSIDQKRLFELIGYAVLLLFIIYSVSTGYVSQIYKYQMRYVTDDVGTKLKNFGIVMIVISLGLLFLEKTKHKFLNKLIPMSAIMVWACMMNGKKVAVFIMVCGILMVSLLNGFIKKVNTGMFLAVCAALGLLFFNSWYIQKYNLNDTDRMVQYENFRVTYGRDDTLKSVIYNELYEQNKILNYRGETFLFYLSTMLLIKREIWPGKPYPFATYFTAYYAGASSRTIFSYTMTTSIIDEMVANMGLFGALVLPFIFCRILSTIMKVADMEQTVRRGSFINEMILCVGILLSIMVFAVQISAFIYIYMIYTFVLFVKSIGMKHKIRFVF